jgi:hypothetical protein
MICVRILADSISWAVGSASFPDSTKLKAARLKARYCNLSKSILLLLCVGLPCLISARMAQGQVESKVEQKRIFGKMFG